jgi:hypothetical protein
MRGGRVLLISAVVHAALAAILSQIAMDAKRVVSQRPADPEREPEPIEIAIIDQAPASAVVPQPSIESSKPRTGASGLRPGAEVQSSDTEMAASTSATTGDEQKGDGHGSSLMRMRGPELGLDPGLAQRIAESGTHAPAPETKISGKLSREPGGRAAIYDTVTTIEIEQDGTAHFHDKPDIDIKFKLPIPNIDIEGMRKDLGALLTDWYADPYASTRFGRTQDLSNINLAVPGACDTWGSVACDDPLAPARERYVREQKKTGGSLLGGNADISAYLHRKFVGDPYASRKLKLLDDTRDERAKMRSDFRAQQLVRSGELIERNLARLEAAKLSPIEKRAALFELWDECSEPTGAPSDEPDEPDVPHEPDEEGQAGQRARAQVIGWIRRHLPEGSLDGYSVEEIAKLNGQRSSKQPFEPY